MKSIGRYSIFPVPLGSQKAHCLVPRGLKCLVKKKKKTLLRAIKEYRALDHVSVKRWRKGSWEGRVRLSHDPLHKAKIAVVLRLRSWRNCYFKRLRFWRQGRLAPNLLLAPSNPAG